MRIIKIFKTKVNYIRKLQDLRLKQLFINSLLRYNLQLACELFSNFINRMAMVSVKILMKFQDTDKYNIEII